MPPTLMRTAFAAPPLVLARSGDFSMQNDLCRRRRLVAMGRDPRARLVAPPAPPVRLPSIPTPKP